MKIRERLIKCGDFGIEQEHMTIETVSALKYYLILRKAGMNILGGRILFYYLEEGTDPETMRKLKDLEKKNKDKICLVSRYETYPAGLAVFMSGDLMYEVMASGLKIKDAHEMAPMEAVKLLEEHLHFTLESEEMEDIEDILSGKQVRKKERKKKAHSLMEDTKTEQEPAGETKKTEEKNEDDSGKIIEDPEREKATVPERFQRKRARDDGGVKEANSGLREEKKSPDPEEEASYFKDERDRAAYLEYEKASREKTEEEEYMDALSREMEMLRENDMVNGGMEDADLEDDFMLNIGDE